jgi:uncharacterized membrane protein
MKTINKTFGETVREASDTVLRIARHALRSVERMSWPSLLAMCVMLALLITILPLAVTLFVLFLLVKLVASAFGISTYHRQRERAATHVHENT